MLKEKGNINKISITDLCKKVSIQRATFYCHYKSLDEVAKDVKEDIFKSFFKNIFISSEQDIIDFYDRMANYLLKHEELLSLLLNNFRRVDISFEMSEMCALKLLNYLSEYTNIPINDWTELETFQFCDGVISQLIRYFTKNPQSH